MLVGNRTQAAEGRASGIFVLPINFLLVVRSINNAVNSFTEKKTGGIAMTLRKSQRSPEDILGELCGSYPGGVEAMAARLDIGAKTLYKKLNSSVPDTALTIPEFSSVISKLEEAGLDCSEALQALCFRHNRVCIEIEDVENPSDDDIYKAVTQVVAQMGSMAGAVSEALDEGEIADRHMEKIEPKMRKSFAVLASLMARIKGRFKRDSSKPRRSLFRRAEKQEAVTA